MATSANKQVAGLSDRATRFRVEIGKLIRARRADFGLTQTDLAHDLGVTQQQILKYEKGVGRIPADSLLALCRKLRIDPGSVFYPLDVAGAESNGFAEPPPPPFGLDASGDREALDLVRAFQRIGEKDVRKRILDLVSALAGDGEPKPRRRRGK